MNEIRIKPIFGSHQIYQEIVNYPPKGIEYVGIGKVPEKENIIKAKK